MKHTFSVTLSLLLLFSHPLLAKHNVDSLLCVLDRAIIDSELYSSRRQGHIDQLNQRLSQVPPDGLERYNLNHQLYQEYRAFICDSAIHYLNNNIILADSWQEPDKSNESRLELSYLLASSGMYNESIDLLETIDSATLSPRLRKLYYRCMDRVYSEMGHYTQDRIASHRYWLTSQAYKDSLHAQLAEDSDELLALKESNLLDTRQFDEAQRINDMRLSKTRFGTQAFAEVIYFRSLISHQRGDAAGEKYYLALSAISDIHSATKDHASLWMLAALLYNEGEMERAYRYMRFSWSETKFFNARLRSWQSADVLSLIDKTYQGMIEKQNDRLESFAMAITLLMLLLVVALIYIYRQMKKLSMARNDLQKANTQLYHLNSELKETNICLQSTNGELSESNQIKEEYIARFVKLCSTYIEKLDAYRRMVNKKITGGQIKELQQITRSQEALDGELAELYANFDSAFLHIFPDFVTKFNALLIDEEQILLKRNELLNTELRIFALIRLGIVDSSQIAEFLRYSVNTIYNYRSKVKNKAKVSREDFEELVKQIR